MSSIKASKVDIATNVIPVDDKHVLATEETLTEMVKNFREFLKKERNVPHKTQRNYPAFKVNAIQYIANIMQATQAMIEQDVIQTDKYGFLSKNVTSFDKYNDLINKELIVEAEKLIQMKHEESLKKAKAEGKTISNEEKELNPTQVAAIAAEPTEDPNSHVLEILTTTNKRWYFDKINYTLSFMKKDGELKIIKLAKKNSWRATVISLFVNCISWIKDKYNTAKDRCIGIKQSIRFKWEMMKYNAKLKAEAKKESKKSQTDFDDLPAQNHA